MSLKGAWDRTKHRPAALRHLSLEWWSRRPLAYNCVSLQPGTNKKAKRICHQIERAQEKRLVRKELDEVHLD